MTLMLHAGGKEVDYDNLRALATPEATATHVPIAHHDVVDRVIYALRYYGHEVAEQHHAVTEDGMRYFGLLTLRSEYGDYTDTVGLRNSHDRKFPVGIGFGSKVFVCDNLAFIADVVVRRKHTINARRDLPGLISDIIEPLADQRQAQFKTFERYKGTPLLPATADQAIMAMYRQGVINVTRIADVVEQFDHPRHEEWGDHTAWTLFNATTAALEGRVAENPSTTSTLHKIIDGVCERVH